MQIQEDDNEPIRQRLIKLVNQRSQSEIARKTGAQVAAVNRYVHGARIPASFCTAMVRGLGVNPSWLLTGEGSPSLTDVPERTAQLGENLLELVEAMSAVSRMLLGSLTGKHHLKVLRELNEALLAHERLRADLNQKSVPVFKRLLDDFDTALNKLDLDRAAELRKAAEQLSRLCDDEELTRHYLRASAFHDFQLKLPERFLDTQRKLFLRCLPDGSLFDETACDEARRLAVALVQMNRIPEARKICVAVRALAGKRGEQWPAWARLENTYSVILCETGHLRPAIEIMQRAIPRLEGMYRKVSEAALTRMLLWANVITFEQAAEFGERTDAKAGHLLQYSIWRVNPAMLKRSLEYASLPDVEAVWGMGIYHLFAAAMHDQLRTPRREAAARFEADVAAKLDGLDNNLRAFALPAMKCELLRVGGFRKEALPELRIAEAERRKLGREITPGPLDLAAHYRAALQLLHDSDAPADRALKRRARKYLDRRIRRGYLCIADGINQA